MKRSRHKRERRLALSQSEKIRGGQRICVLHRYVCSSRRRKKGVPVKQNNCDKYVLLQHWWSRMDPPSFIYCTVCNTICLFAVCERKWLLQHGPKEIYTKKITLYHIFPVNYLSDFINGSQNVWKTIHFNCKTLINKLYNWKSAPLLVCRPQITSFSWSIWRRFILVEMGNLHLQNYRITGTGAPEAANKSRRRLRSVQRRELRLVREVTFLQTVEVICLILCDAWTTRIKIHTF